MQINGYTIEPSADLRDADLRDADLRGANLQIADMQGANLSGADLQRASLYHAALQGANLYGAIMPDTIAHPPDTGNFIAYKKLCNSVVIALFVPATARRTGCYRSNKCRVEYAVAQGSGSGLHNGWEYNEGELVSPDSYNDDPREECTNGIHCFLTKKEAEEYNY